MPSLMTKSFIFILLINALGRTEALYIGGKKPSTSLNSKSIFAPNSAIFKIPVSKTVNLDFRKSNETRIESELLKVLTELLKNKDVEQEKIVLNIKPPTASNNSFVKNFTSLLRRETTFVVPTAVVGAQSTIFKKKNGQISTLRLTLYVVRQKKPTIPQHDARRDEPRKDIIPEGPTKPITEEASINMTQTENVTATVENVLRQLHENSTGIHNTDIYLNLISPTNFSNSQINNLKASIKQILLQLYPNSTTSTKTRLFKDKKAHVSRLEFEIDVKPRLPVKHEPEILEKFEKPIITNLNMTISLYLQNATKPSEKSITVNGTKSIENTTSVVENILLTDLKNITERQINKSIILVDLSFSKKFSEEQKDNMEKSLKDVISKLYPDSRISMKNKLENDQKLNISKLSFEIIVEPKHPFRRSYESSRPKLNVTVLSPESLQASLDTLKADLQNLVPYSQVLVQAQNMIFKDLDILTDAMRSQEKKLHEEKIPIDLRMSGSSITDELDKVLPDILTTLKKTVKPINLAFKVTLPNELGERSVNSDICAIMKELTRRIPEKTRFGDVNIDVTLLPDTNELLPNRYTEGASPLLSEIKPVSDAASSPYFFPRASMRLLNLTEPRINITEKINSTLAEIMRQLPNYEKNSEHLFNMSMILPQNGSKLSVEDILNIIKRNVMVLYPYSQILIQAESMIHRDLHILNLNLGLKRLADELDQSRKNEEVVPIDLSELREDKPEEIEESLMPLWSNITKDKPMNFDLKLRPANDLDRRGLGNDICSIVDILSKSIPDDVLLNEISFKTTVTPEKIYKAKEDKVKDEEGDDDFSEESEETTRPTTLLDLTNPGTNMTKEIHSVLEKFVQEMKNDTRSIVSGANFSLSVFLPENETLNVGDTLRTIREDLLKLAPYADIIIRTQHKIEDEIHMLELKIQMKQKESRKKFRINLRETGDFIPKEVDEIVFNIRTSKNPFSFALEMVIPESADLEASSSEICSVNNIVINNIPKQSILGDTILKISISPKNIGHSIPENSQRDEIRNNDTEGIKNSTAYKFGSMENAIPSVLESKKVNTQEMEKSLPLRSEEQRDAVSVSRSEEEMSTRRTLENIDMGVKPIGEQITRKIELSNLMSRRIPSYSEEKETEPKQGRKILDSYDSGNADAAQQRANPSKKVFTKDLDEASKGRINEENVPEIPYDKIAEYDVDVDKDHTTESISKTLRDYETVPAEKYHEQIRTERNNNKYQVDEESDDERSEITPHRSGQNSENAEVIKDERYRNVYNEVKGGKSGMQEKPLFPNNEPRSEQNSERAEQIKDDRYKNVDDEVKGGKNGMQEKPLFPNNEPRSEHNSEKTELIKDERYKNLHDEVKGGKHGMQEKPLYPKNKGRGTETTAKKEFNDDQNDVLNRMKKAVDQNLTKQNELEDKSDLTTASTNSGPSQVPSKPRTFTTAPIDLDNLNLLDVESVLSKEISKYIPELNKSKDNNEKIIIDFVFKTSRISSTNLDNIESVLDDVFDALNIKGEVMPDDVKLGLTEENDIVVHIPCMISASKLEENSLMIPTPTVRPKIKTPKPLEKISDLILEV